MIRKVFLCLIITVILSIGLCSFAESDIKVIIKGVECKFDVPPQIQNGRTLVPLRAIFESLGAKVEWDGTTGTITGTKDDTTVVLKLNSTDAKVNGKIITLDTPATSSSGRTFVPTRFISESLGMHVAWNGDNKTIDISPNEIVEWRYEGFEESKPYKDYERKYVDGEKQVQTRYTGKNHEFKKINLYTDDGLVKENVSEEQVKDYTQYYQWATEPIIGKTYWIRGSYLIATDLDTGDLTDFDEVKLFRKVFIENYNKDDMEDKGNETVQYNSLICIINDKKCKFKTIYFSKAKKEGLSILNEDPEKMFCFGKNEWKALNSYKIWIGMDATMLKVAKGFPDKVNKSVGSYGTYEQWIYRKNSGDKYYYVENDILKSWQE